MKYSYKKLMSGFLLPFFMLVLTTNSGAKNPDKSNQAPKTSEWYMRFTVEERLAMLKDRGNVLGHLKDSQQGYDSHDLLELDPFNAPYLTLIYAHPDWGEHSGNYSSDYHPPSLNKADQWLFQVNTDDPNRDITLYWDPVTLVNSDWDTVGRRTGWKIKQDSTGLISRMWLEDLLTGEKIDAVIEGQLQSYTFNMSGDTVRHFRWVLNSRGGRPPKVKTTKQQGIEYFDLPSENSSDRMHYPPEHEL